MNHLHYDREYLDYCKRERKLSPHSIRSYEFVIKQFWEIVGRDFGVDSPQDIRKEITRSYLRTLGELYGPRSATHHFGIMKTYFSYMEEMDVIEYSPFHKIFARMRPERRDPTVLTANEVNRILNSAYSAPRDTPFDQFIYYRDCIVLEFLFATGMRVQELCDLTLHSIDIDSGIVQVLGKGRKRRKCFISSPQVRELYKQYLGVRRKCMSVNRTRHFYAFISRNGCKITSQAVRDMTVKHGRRAGLDRDITPHYFRHTFASMLIESGVDLSFVQKYLGHSTISTTQIYLHLSDQRAMEVLQSSHPRMQMQVLTPQ